MRKLFSIVCVLATAVASHGALALSDSSIPTKIPTYWGQSAPSGDITCPIPIPSQISIAAGRASWTDGFPPITFNPVAAGGVPPFGQDMNGILCQLSQWTRWQNAGNPIFYDNTFSSAIGGYPNQAMLSVASGGPCFWVSDADNNTSDPDTGGANWINTCTVGGVLSGTVQNASIVNSGVTAGTYIAPTFTVGSDGRVTTASSGSGNTSPVNLGLSASAASNALTINLTTASGATPSASSPVIIPFRSLTAATGTMTQVKVTSALSVTIPANATLGTTNSIAFRIWIFASYNGSQVQLAVATCSNQTTLFGCKAWESSFANLQTLNSSSTSAGVPYAANNGSGQAVRIIGYCEYGSGLTTAGTWASACTTLQPFDAGIAKPGDLIQTVETTTTTNTSCNSTFTNTAVAQTIDVTAAPNLVIAHVVAYAAINGNSSGLIRLNNGSGLFGGQAGMDNSVNEGIAVTIPLFAINQPNATGNVTYTLQCEASPSSGDFSINGANGNAGSSIMLEEIMGMVDPVVDEKRKAA